MCDFNLSRVMDNAAVLSSLNANNPRWLAPEVILRQGYSKASDVFAFGVVLWELATWVLPWESMGPFQVRCRRASEEKASSNACMCPLHAAFA